LKNLHYGTDEISNYFSENRISLDQFYPSEIKGTGYWGIPSSTAVTPYDSLCFAAFSITKREEADFSEE
jgi:hypothetical protein